MCEGLGTIAMIGFAPKMLQLNQMSVEGNAEINE